MQRRPGPRRLPGYHGASGSSWLPSRRPSHDLLRQQLLHCICTAGGGGGKGTSAGTWCPRRSRTDTTNMSLPSVMRPPGMAVRKAPAGPPDEPRSLVGSRCPLVMLMSMLHNMSAWHAPSTFLVTSCCGPSNPFLLSTNSVYRSFAVASHLHCSVSRLWRLLHRCHTEAPLAPCRGPEGKVQLVAPSSCVMLGQRRPRTRRPRLRWTACATLGPHDAAGESSAYPP